jgi:hypothetical protein
VLGLRSYDVLLFRRVEPRNPLDGHVIAFGSTRREDNLLGVCANQRRHVPTRLLHCAFCFPTIVVRARVRIAILPRHQRQHGVKHTRVHRSGALVIQKGGTSTDHFALDVKNYARIVRRHLQPASLLPASSTCHARTASKTVPCCCCHTSHNNGGSKVACAHVHFLSAKSSLEALCVGRVFFFVKTKSFKKPSENDEQVL